MPRFSKGRRLSSGRAGAGVCAILALLTEVSQAAPAVQSSEGLSGDWGGARSWLFAHGIELEGSYINEFALTAGGAPSATADADQFYVGGALNLQRLARVAGAQIIFSFTDRNGTSLSLQPGHQTLLEVQEIYGEGNYTRLNQLYWKQQLLDGKLTLKFGRLTGTFDFMPFSCHFQNITFCATITSHNVVPNWVAFPGGTWAGVVRFAPNPQWYAQFGVYEVNPSLQQHGARFTLGEPFGGVGRRVVSEFGWLPDADAEGSAYRLGLWYDDVGGSDFYLNRAGRPLATDKGSPLQHHQQSGFYAMAQQRIWGTGVADKRGVSVFLNFVQADRQVSVKDQIAEIGVFWVGPLAARPHDEIGAAIARVHVSSRLAASERLYNARVAEPDDLPLQGVQGYEFPLEIYYSLAPNPAVTIRPNLQIIRSPEGVRERSALVVVGLHVSVLL
jgi:porin